MKAIVEAAPDFEHLIREWAALYRNAAPNFFLSPVWVSAWLMEFGAKTNISLVRVCDNENKTAALGLFGIAPARPGFRFRRAHLHETGIDRLDRIYIEYNDFLLSREAAEEARYFALSAMTKSMPRVEQFVFRNVKSALRNAVARIGLEHGFFVEPVRTERTYQINLSAPVNFEEFENYSSSLRAKIRRSIRRYEERGALVLERVEGEAERATAWEELTRLHRETWRRRGQQGAFANENFIAFLEVLMRENPDCVDFVRLTAGGEVIGVLLNFIEGRTVYNYQSGFLYENDNQLAPGFVCHALAALRYRQHGFSIYDLLAGEADYKTRLAEPGESLETVTLTRKGVKSALRSIARTIKP